MKGVLQRIYGIAGSTVLWGIMSSIGMIIGINKILGTQIPKLGDVYES